MKKKKILIVIICIIVLFLIFLLVNHFVIKRGETSNNSDNNLIDRTYNGLTLTLTDGIDYEITNDNKGFILKSNTWSATIDPRYDEYDYILSYPICTQRIFLDDETTLGDLKKSQERRKYIYFTLSYNEENYIYSYYRISDKVVMFINLKNNDGSFDESGLETIYKILDTIKHTETANKYNYKEYKYDWYHQCHDVNKLDEEDFSKTNKEFEKQIKE